MGTKKATKKMTKKKGKTKKMREHKVGDKYFVYGIACVTRYVNNGYAWIFPEIDDDCDPCIAKHIAYAKIDDKGKVTIL